MNIHALLPELSLPTDDRSDGQKPEQVPLIG